MREGEREIATKNKSENILYNVFVLAKHFHSA
jgi:hypothetical protein